MVEGIVVGFLGLFYAVNYEFIHKVKRDMDRGYKWEYVGKTKPSGVPAITMQANGEEYILWKLKK